MDSAHRVALSLSVAAALVATAEIAAAQIAVATVTGDASLCDGLCRQAVVDAVEDRALEAVRAPAGSRGSPGRHLARSGAEMLLVPEVVGQPRRRSVRLRGYLADGTCFFDERRPTRGGSHAARLLGRMVDALLDGEGLDALTDDGGGRARRGRQPEDEEEDEEDRRGPRERLAERQSPAPRVAADRPVPVFGATGAEAEGEVRSRTRVEAEAGRTPFLSLQAGINLTARTLEMPLSGGEATREYRGGAYPGFELSTTVLPAAPFVRSWAGNFGVHVRYGRHIVLSSYYDGRVLETSQEQADVLAVYRLPLTGRRDGFALTGGLGYMRLAFQVPEAGAADDFVYQAMAVGLELEAPLPWAGLAIRAGVRYGMVLNMGEVGRAFAQAATVHGYDAQLELSGRIVAGLRYVVAFEVFGFESTFVGHGDLGQAASAHDVFFRGRAGLAYQFSTGG